MNGGSKMTAEDLLGTDGEKIDGNRTEADTAQWAGINESHLDRLRRSNFRFNGEIMWCRGGWSKRIAAAETRAVAIVPIPRHQEDVRDYLVVHDRGPESSLRFYPHPTLESALAQAEAWEKTPPNDPESQ